MKDDRRARLKAAVAAVVLLAVGAGALLLLWPEAEVDEGRASVTSVTSVADRSAGAQAPHVALDASDADEAKTDASTPRFDDPTRPDDLDGGDDGPPAEAPGVGRLSGRVAGPGDSVVAGAVVLAYASNRGRREREPLRIEVDALGRFDAVVPATNYRVGAEAPGHVAGRYAPGVVRKDGATDVGTVTLRRAQSTLSGRVLGAGGVPLAGATVFAEDDDRGEQKKSTSGPDGAFAIGGLPEGVYSVRARAAGHVASDRQDVAVTEAQGGEVTLQLQAGGRVAGTITDPKGAPVPGASVFVYRERARVAATEADAQGRFDLDGLPAGAVELFTRTGDYAQSARAAVDVVAGGLVIRDVALSAGSLITGRITDAQGAPVNELYVIAQALGGDVERTGRSDADGRYSIVHLYPGRYRVAVARGGPHGPSEPPRMIAEVDVTTGPATCDIVSPAGAVVAGTVLRDDGQPLENAQVHAIQDGETRGVDQTDEAGRFRIEALPPGSYRLFVRVGGPRAVGQLVGHLDQDLAADAVVEGLRVLVRPPARVRGRVVDPAGRPVPDLELTLQGVDGPVWRSARTDQDGRFELFPLYDGEYQLEAEPGPLLLLARRLEADRATLAGRRVAIAQGRDVAFDLRVALE